jgi:hypothetical protein
MSLRFPHLDIQAVAARYNVNDRERAIEASVPVVREQQYLTRDQLFLLCQWKNEHFPQIAALANNNSSLFVKEITRFALAVGDERARIEPLCLLDGVELRTASTVLHWYHPEPYPILDIRALWSLTIEQPRTYSFTFWTAYLNEWRDTLIQAQQILGHGVLTPRMLDRALWQYCRENQQLRQTRGPAGSRGATLLH